VFLSVLGCSWVFLGVQDVPLMDEEINYNTTICGEGNSNEMSECVDVMETNYFLFLERLQS
jgi:hypothetical protein